MLNAVTFNDQEFAFEKFEHEVVVLHLVDGTYYAFGGSAVIMWDHLAARRKLSSMHLLFDATNDNGAGTISDRIAGFAEQLVAERIFRPAEPSEDQPPETHDGASTVAFQPPTFEKHADMQDLLTLDPIHDVDPEKGWPHT